MTEDAEAVLFDMDGTLIDSRKNAVRSVKKGMKSLDNDVSESVPIPSEDRITSLIGVPSDQYFQRLLPEDLRHYRDQVAERIGEYEREGISQGNVSFYDGIESILDTLAASGLHLGLVTNAGRDYFEAHRKQLDLDRFFDLLYCVDDSPSKEKQELVERFLRKKDQPETLLVGDRSYDIEAAHRHDVRSVGVLWGYGNHEELKTANHTVDAPNELAEILPGVRGPSTGSVDFASND